MFFGILCFWAGTLCLFVAFFLLFGGKFLQISRPARFAGKHVVRSTTNGFAFCLANPAGREIGRNSTPNNTKHASLWFAFFVVFRFAAPLFVLVALFELFEVFIVLYYSYYLHLLVLLSLYYATHFRVGMVHGRSGHLSIYIYIYISPRYVAVSLDWFKLVSEAK